MSKIKKLPTVSIVGRTNVGKSTLFNRISKGKKSLVFERENVTRDYISEVIKWDNKHFNLIDTGGLPLKKSKDAILKKVEDSVQSIIEKSDSIIFVCDAKSGPTQKDQTIARMLHKSGKKVFAVINKADNTKALEENIHEFAKLGFKDFFKVSAVHGTGIPELLDSVTKEMTEKEGVEKPSLKIAILGKPNVGKSSLLNSLVKKERSIVSEVAGTTREAVTETMFFHKNLIQLIDTAGLRRKCRIDDPLEVCMSKDSLKAVRTSDIILLVIDVKEGKLSDQELRILSYAQEQRKHIILILNKTDLLEEDDKQLLEYNLERYEFLLKKLPIIRISCETQKNIGKVLEAIKEVESRREQEIDGKELYELIKSYLLKKPMFHKTQLLKVHSIKPSKVKGVHTFTLKVNLPEFFGQTQLGFIENLIRKHYNLVGCPIKFVVRK